MEWDRNEFMQPQTTNEDFIEYTWYGDTYFVPASVEGTLPDDATIDERHQDVWFARLSAPGYMDCTDWVGPFDTEEEAEEHLVETYQND